MNKKTNHKHHSESLKEKSVFSRSTLIAFMVVFGIIGGYFLIRSFAASPTPPTVYLSALSPASQVLPVSTPFSVQVRENSGATAVNAVQANFSYDSTLVTLSSIDTTGTAFTTDASTSGGSGTVSIGRGIIGSVTGDQLIATINFTTKTTGGSVPMAFTSGTALVNSSTNLDILGSLAATGGLTYTIDTTPPTVTLTAPANGATVALGSTTNITATATDVSSSIPGVDFYVDGTLKSTDAGSPYSYSWNTTGLSLGAHTIQAKSTDSSGNLGVSSTISVTVADQTAPATPVGLAAQTTTLTSITLVWNASSDNIGVTGYRVQRGGVTLTTTASLTYADSGLTANTSYTYTVVALDAAGNASTAATLTTSTSAVKTGDLNSDNAVTIIDLSILLSHWSTNNATSDINHDGTVNIFDLSLLLSHYGS